MIRETDIKVADDWDLEVGPNGDLQIANASRTAVQDVMFRMRSQRGELKTQPDFGASLEAFIGQANTRELGRRMQSEIFRALTRDNRFAPATVRVEVAPIAHDEVVALIGLLDLVEGLSGSLIVSFRADLSDGNITLMR